MITHKKQIYKVETLKLANNPDKGEVVHLKKDKLFLQLQVAEFAKGIYNYEIIDFTGDVIQYSKIFSNTHQINCENFTEGIYIFNVYSKLMLLCSFRLEINIL